jgi:hypothetical protein
MVNLEYCAKAPLMKSLLLFLRVPVIFTVCENGFKNKIQTVQINCLF